MQSRERGLKVGRGGAQDLGQVAGKVFKRWHWQFLLLILLVNNGLFYIHRGVSKKDKNNISSCPCLTV